MRTGLTGCCCPVQIWSTNQANSVAEIDIKANVCCAKYNPESMYEIAVGAADHTVLTYDLRKSDKAVHTYKGTFPAQQGPKATIALPTGVSTQPQMNG